MRESASATPAKFSASTSPALNPAAPEPRAAAYQIRSVLNPHPSAPALDVGRATPLLGATWARRVVVYTRTAVSLAALLLGVFWQRNH